ncbi:MAG: hypothetical protein HW399_1031 [Dehalococcoidia bacterium]|nr:hypothetical protein [Dehalococcoidia bacterium]
MVTIYVTSLNGSEGKTALCLGLGKKWQKAGKKVGYFKPVSVKSTQQPASTDADTAFARQVLGLAEPIEKLSPLLLTAQDIAGISKKSAPDQKLTKACSDVAAGKDILLLEGLSGSPEASANIARCLGAKVVLVAHHKADLSTELPKAAKAFGQTLAGVIINAVPQGKLGQVTSTLAPLLGKAGAKVLGVLPQERSLVGVTVEELSVPLQASILKSQDGIGEVVENIMGGAIFLDSGPLYFERKANKAVVIRIDRPDVQLGALETSVRCLILTNAEGEPNPYVYYKAMDKGVPILLTKMDTAAALAAIETTLNRARFRQEKKLEPLAALLEKNLDFAVFNKALGI